MEIIGIRGCSGKLNRWVKKNRTIEVCLSPVSFYRYDSANSIVVVIDVLRATSSICVAFYNGAERIVPVDTVEESMTYRKMGFLVGADIITLSMPANFPFLKV